MFSSSSVDAIPVDISEKYLECVRARVCVCVRVRQNKTCVCNIVCEEVLEKIKFE